MEQVTLKMSGGGPFGFRLYGGEGDPLVVAKLRKRSKAHDAGMQEGDVLLSINGHPCQTMSHGAAMSLVDAAAAQLVITALRGDSSSTAAYLPAGPEPLTTMTSQPLSSMTSQAPAFNGLPSANRSVQRDEQTTRDGDATKRVTTETTTEKFGGTTITKTRRQEVTSYDPQILPRQEKNPKLVPKPMFQPSSASVAPKPGVWTPSGPPAPKTMTVSAPSGVQLHHNPDQSVTMTLGFPGETDAGFDALSEKENTAPQFKVNRVMPSKPATATWQPANAPLSKPAPPPPVEDEPDLTHDPRAAPIYPGGAPDQYTDPAMDGAPRPRPLHLQRILIEGPGSSDECPDSPATELKKMDSPGISKLVDKKLFGDSAFYDDPEHKYPTIEEQIKMARRVAMSLLSPRNEAARGYKMFVRRAERADKWSTDHPGGPSTKEDSDEEVDEGAQVHYNPDPWKPSHTWVPTGNAGPIAGVVEDGIIPKPPPLPESLFSTPTLPKLKKADKSSAMSANELERMRLFEQKNPHTGVSPQVCFSLADDLRNMKGKGGKLFAKRKEKSKKWVVDEQEDAADGGPDPAFLKKIGAVPAMPMPGMMMPGMLPKKKDTDDGGVPVNRLKSMIDPPKPKMTPWDAAAENQGCTDKAFEHLIGYRPFQSGSSVDASMADTLQMAAQKSEGAKQVPTPLPGLGEAAAKRKMWTNPNPAPAPDTPKSQGESFTSSSESPFASKPAPGFRPVSFKLPSMTSSGSWSSNASFPNSGRGGGDPPYCGRPLEAGVCDL